MKRYLVFAAFVASSTAAGATELAGLDANRSRTAETAAAIEQFLISDIRARRPSGPRTVANRRLPQPYRDLRDALEHYREIARAGGWQKIPRGKSLRAAVEDDRVRLLRERLALTDDYRGGSWGAEYDRDLEEAVRRFQERHGLDADGAVGPETLDELNVPVEERIRQIELNITRIEATERLPRGRRIVVNVPEFRLRAWSGDSVVDEMAVVVGAKKTSTPIFSDQIEHVIFNPTWDIPYSITRNEILPELRSDSRYLERMGYGVVGKAPDETEALVEALEAGEARLMQGSGARNALGRLKFIFPNRHSVYLHDTPQKKLFTRRVRAFSHGCIRVEDPLRLARFVLEGLAGWDDLRIARAIESGKHRFVRLDEVVPVQIVYWTAFVENGALNFREDIYRHDAALRASF